MSRLDSVEVKVTLGKEHVRAALSAFGLTAEEGRERLIYFCADVTPQTSAGTPLIDPHVILRARSGDEEDTTVKPAAGPADAAVGPPPSSFVRGGSHRSGSNNPGPRSS